MKSCHSNLNCRGESSRVQGCLMGQLAGDTLGSLVEFQLPEEIQRNYPNGVCERVNAVE